MNKEEAIVVLRRHLDRVEVLGYETLSYRIGDIEAFEITASSGRQYQIEIIITWDHKPYGAIRILGSIDDGGLRAFFPLSDSRLLVSPARKTSENDPTF